MKKEQIGRLAFRVEGDLWVAYGAVEITMRDAARISRAKRQRIIEDDT